MDSPRCLREPWNPILEGELKTRAQEAIDQLADCLHQAEPSSVPHGMPTSVGVTKSATLASGRAGLALFYAYRARASLRESDDQTASLLLDQAAETVESIRMPPGLFEGFTGVAWAFEHLLGERNDLQSEEINEEIDNVLGSWLDESPWSNTYDLISGLAGLGVYSLERLPRPIAAECIESVVDRLQETARSERAGLSWWTRPEWLDPWSRQRYPGGYHDLGVAHGIPGIVAFLARVCSSGVASRKARTLLEGSVAWLLDQRCEETQGSRYASFAGPGIELHPARSAWCYGDPGIASVLMIAARCSGNLAWEREAIDLARQSAHRPMGETRVVDPGLCHGAAGLAHIYNRLYQATGDTEFRDAATAWFERALAFRHPGRGIAGFSAWNPIDAEGSLGWCADPGLLTGAAGVGLALLAATTDVPPDWDRVMLASSPMPIPAVGAA